MKSTNLTCQKTPIVVGGCTLVALGPLEEDGDIDICVTPEIFAIYKVKGWRQEEGFGGKPVLKHDIYDIGVGFGQWSLEDLQTDALTINSIPFMSIEKLLQWKRKARRPKDLQHIRLIEQYLKLA